jgi:sec-independent protein translocase protein TatB
MLGPDLSFSHILIVAAVALIVVGPKDLPMLLRKVGQFVARMRGMAAEFRSSFDEMARQSELDELRKEVAAMRTGQYGASSVMGDDASQVFSDIDAGLRGGDVSFSPAMAHYEPPVEEPAAKPKRVRKPKTIAEPEAQTIAKPAAATRTRAPRETKPAAIVEPAAKPARKRPARKPPEIVS